MGEIVEHAVHLVEPAFPIFVLHPKLVAIGLTDGAVLARPLVPDMAVQIADAVGFFLPDPEELIDGVLQVGLAQGEDRKFLAEIVAIDDPKTFHSVRRRAVAPARAHVKVRVPDAGVEDLANVLLKNLIGSAHHFLLPSSPRVCQTPTSNGPHH